MADIIGLRGVTPPHEPVPSVVQALERFLAEAQRGEIRAVAFAMVKADASVVTGWEKPYVPGNAPAVTMENHGLASAILTLAYRYAKAGDE